jgi:hypothetical protein
MGAMQTLSNMILNIEEENKQSQKDKLILDILIDQNVFTKIA